VFSSSALKIAGVLFILLGPLLTITDNVNKNLPLIETPSELILWLVFGVIGILSYAHGTRKTQSFLERTTETHLSLLEKNGSTKFTISPPAAIFIIITCAFFSVGALYLSLTQSEAIERSSLFLSGLFCALTSAYFLYTYSMRVPLLLLDSAGVHFYKLESRIRGQTFIPWNLITDIKLNNKSVFTPYLPHLVSSGFIEFTLNRNNMDESTPRWLTRTHVVSFNAGMLNHDPEAVFNVVQASSNNLQNK
jgi:hypothetical protein